MKTAYVEIRGQHSLDERWQGGPDTYVAVQIVPDGVERLKTLNRKIAERRGIEIRRIGEGYSEHRGPKSSLGKAIARAEKIAQEINEVRTIFLQPTMS